MALSVHRFRKWGIGHQKRVLKRADLTPEKFANLSPRKQREALTRAGVRKPTRPPRPDLIAPRSYRDVQREGKAAGELEFGPALRAKRAELRGAQTFATQKLPHFYDEYRRAVADASERSRQAYAQTQAQQARAEQDVQAQYAQEQARRAREAQEMGRVTGTAPTAPPEASQAAVSRGRIAQDFSGLLGQRAATSAATFGQLGAAGAQRGIEAQQAERKHQAGIEAELQDLRRQRGAFGTDFTRKARGEERQFALERQAFNLKVASEGARHQEAVARTRESKRTHDLAHADRVASRALTDKNKRADFVGKYNRTPEQFQAMSAPERRRLLKRLKSTGTGTKKQGGPSHANRVTAAEGFDKALGYLKSTGYSLEDLASDPNAPSIPESVLHAAYFAVHGKKIPRKLVQKIQGRYGWTPPKRYR